jgi:hypothetical protein
MMATANKIPLGFHRALLVIGLLLSGLQASGQAWLNQPISINAVNESRANLLFQISEQADVGVTFNSTWFEFKERIDLTAEQRSVKEILDLIFAGTSLAYEATETLLSIKRKRIILSGYLEDANNGERLVGGNVYAPASQRGVVTNSYGFFSLEVPASDSVFQFSYLGYETASLNLPLENKVRLRPDADLPEVVVLAYPETPGLFPSKSGSSHRITGQQLQRHGGVGGEADIFNLLHQTTDSQRGADGLGGIFVRGGGADQNLTLLDDAPVFQPSHAFGLFSVINPLIVRSAVFHQDGFPARFGGRLGSVLDVRSREGNTKHVAAELALSTIATKLSLEVPTFKNKGAFLLAARRTHLDPLIAGTSRRRKDRLGDIGEVNYDFYDLNLKWHHTLSSKDKIYLSGYRGGDAYGNLNYAAFSFEENGQSNTYEEDLTQDLDWGNTKGTLRWNHLFNDRLFANTTLTYGKYSYLSDNLLDTREAGITDTVNTFFYGHFQSVIRDLNLKVDFDYYQGDHHFRFGAFALSRRFLPGAVLDEFSQDSISREEIISASDEEFSYPGFNSTEGGVYLEDQFEIGPEWRLTMGLRFTAYHFETATHFLPQPRLSLGWQKGENTSVRLSLDRMVQALHLLTDSGANLPTDLWVPATSDFSPQDSWQVSLAAGGSPAPALSLQFNAYYRTMRNLLQYSDEINWPSLANDSAEFWEEQVVQGTGHSYGLSLNFKHQGDRQILSGGYFYSRSLRTFSGLNSGEVFPFSFDRPHKIMLNLERQITDKLRLHAHWELASGRPITLLETDTEYDPLDNFPSFNYVQLTDLNDFRLSAYHRLDLALEWRWHQKRPQSLQIGIYNIYNRANAYYAYDYNDPFSAGESEQLKVRSLPILPSLNYSIKFGKQ